jgi:hypothetical protein
MGADEPYSGKADEVGFGRRSFIYAEQSGTLPFAIASKFLRIAFERERAIAASSTCLPPPPVGLPVSPGLNRGILPLFCRRLRRLITGYLGGSFPVVLLPTEAKGSIFT